MIEVGKINKLKVINQTDFGVYLGENSEEKVLLPKKQVPENVQPGDELDVFVYRDSSDRIISTTKVPQIQLEEVAVLQVKEVTKIGAFLDWGLEKDLLLPFSEQTKKVEEGDEFPVALYMDKSGRLCATMKLYDYMVVGKDFHEEDVVEGTVYEIKPELGVFVAVKNKYFGLIPEREISVPPSVGEVIYARVTRVREDGKLNLSLRKKAYLQMDDDAKKVLVLLEKKGGVLPYGEKVSSEQIRKDFQLSKNAFKRAIGRLYKEEKIIIEENRIFLKEEK